MIDSETCVRCGWRGDLGDHMDFSCMDRLQTQRDAALEVLRLLCRAPAGPGFHQALMMARERGEQIATQIAGGSQ